MASIAYFDREAQDPTEKGTRCQRRNEDARRKLDTKSENTRSAEKFLSLEISRLTLPL